MASGERLTLTYSHPPSGPLKVDLYCFVPVVSPIDPNPNLEQLPFLLFLHSGDFLTGSRRDVPPWLVSLARSLGTPLLCADYRLAPHCGPSHAFEDLENLWTFIHQDLKWIIACSGNGAEVESGTQALTDDFEDLQRRGGIDPTKGVIVGLGAGGYSAALGGAYLSPPPIALVLGYPTLEFDGTGADDLSLAKVPTQYSDILNHSEVSNIANAKSIVPDTPLLLERAPYAMNVRESCGMDSKENWTGIEESRKRKGLVQYLYEQKQWESILRKASPHMVTPFEVLASETRVNRPYPPTIVFHGTEDTRVPYSASETFVNYIRKAEPVAAAVDALASDRPTTYPLQEQSSNLTTTTRNDTNTTSFKSVDPNPNITNRYLFLGIQGPGSGHGFDALLPRTLSSGPFTKESIKVMGSRYSGGMIHVEHFVRHWLAEGSAANAAKSSAERHAQESLSVEGKAIDGRHANGARVKVPRGGPRL